MTGTENMKTPMSTGLDEGAIQELRTSLRGALLRPGDDSYEATRRVWNGMIDRKPALIVRCAGVADVITAVNFARTNHLLVSVRGGGHSVAGNAVCDGGLMIDLSGMKGIQVDPARRTARAEPGLTWGEFDDETQAFGLATTGGFVPTTGIAGLNLGGGIGFLMRQCGLTCDNLLSVDLVTADGQRLSASATENADLFWGIRGGGGNFGIVTTFEYKLYPVGPLLLAGSVLHSYEHARGAMQFYRTFSTKAPDELSVDAALVTAPACERFFSVSACYVGSIDEGERVLKPLREYGAPVEDRIAPISYLQIQSAGDSIFPRGRRYYWKAQFLGEITDRAIDTLL